MRNRGDLALATKNPSGETAESAPPGTEVQTLPSMPSPDGAVLDWLDDMIRDVDDAATRLKRLAERLRET